MAKPHRTAVVFVHGLARKPAPDMHQRIWLWGLSRKDPKPDVFARPNSGIDVPAGSFRFNYYADVFYGDDYETDLGAYEETIPGQEDGDTDEQVAQIEEALQLSPLDAAFSAHDAVTPREQAFIEMFERKLSEDVDLTSSELGSSTEDGLEIASWLPDPIKQAVIKKAAMEAYYFLFDKVYRRPDGKQFQVRRELRRRLLDDLKWASDQAERIVVVSHSMGTMVAYDVLRNCPECPNVDTLFTLGSPLGVREVQDELIAVGQKDVDFPAAKLAKWLNIYDPLDPICGADPRFRKDYRPVDDKSVTDVKESNWGKWRHTITHYFAGKRFRGYLAEELQK